MVIIPYKGDVMKDTFFVILAGGNGERLWPLSSPARSKQLIPFINGTTLLEQTITRIQALVKNKNHLFITTNIEQQDTIKKLLGKQANILAEPTGRNTGPAILFSCLELADKDDDAVVVILPSDHFIPETEPFVSILWAAIAYASCYDHLVLLGVKPTHPSTSYGYIQYQAEQFVPGWACFPVQKFHEKPEKDQAQEYVQRSDMLWNTGIFIGRVAVIMQQFKQWAPELYEAMLQYRQSKISYDQLPKISIDHAVIERSDKKVVFCAPFIWYDVGTLPAFLQLKSQYETGSVAKIINIDAHDNLASTSKKTVAFVGVNNLCVVETDDALLIVPQDRVESVREVSAKVNQQDHKHEKILDTKISQTSAV